MFLSEWKLADSLDDIGVKDNNGLYDFGNLFFQIKYFNCAILMSHSRNKILFSTIVWDFCKSWLVNTYTYTVVFTFMV